MVLSTILDLKNKNYLYNYLNFNIIFIIVYRNNLSHPQRKYHGKDGKIYRKFELVKRNSHIEPANR